MTISTLLAALRAHRPLQVAAAVIAVGGLAFAWWTLSPFFIRPVVVETDRAATVAITSVAPRPTLTAAPTGAPAAVPTDTPEPIARVIARGELQRIDALHAGSGPVTIFELEGRTILRFEDVSILNGPDLQVYLGKGSAGEYDGERDLHLGPLKAPEGTFTYDVAADIDPSEYRSVVVWCRVFRVVFTYADLTFE